MFFIIGADGKEYGPVTVTRIQEWITGGRANLETKARRVDDPEWKTLGNFVEFGGAAVPPRVAAASVAGESAPSPVVVTTTPAPASVFTEAVSRTGGLELANRWARLGAALLDTIISGLLVTPGMVMIMLSGAMGTPDSANTPLMLAGIGTFCLAALILIAVQIYLLVTRGQTVGKILMKIKIVDFETEANPGFVKVFLLRIVVNAIIGMVPFLGSVYGLVDVLFIFREDHRCIHDLIAGTKVVKA